MGAIIRIRFIMLSAYYDNIKLLVLDYEHQLVGYVLCMF